jgi:hypothetical protein
MPGGRAARAWRDRDQQDPERRWRWLKKHPLWEEIELRLRHRWSPREVERWLRTDHATVKPVSFQTLYRYLEEKPEEWYIAAWAVSPRLQRSVSRLMVLEEHAALYEAMKRRVIKLLELETAMNGLPIPETRAGMEVLTRMLEAHQRMLQQMGVVPSVGGALGRPADDDPGDDRGFAALVRQIVDLPKDEFGTLLTLALGGPPERTQPPAVEPPRVIDVASERVEAPDPDRPDPSRPA